MKEKKVEERAAAPSREKPDPAKVEKPEKQPETPKKADEKPKEPEQQKRRRRRSPEVQSPRTETGKDGQKGAGEKNGSNGADRSHSEET